MRLRNKKTILVGIGIAGVIALAIVGVTGALNGWFGGGGSIPEDTFTRGLVAYWSFDEGSGNIAYDASGNGNHGTLTNGPKWTHGKIGGALSFDGVDDYVQVPDSPVLTPKSFTVSSWIYPFSTSGYRPFLVKNNGSNNRLDLSVYYGKILFTRCNGTSYSDIQFGTITANQWYFVAISYDYSSGELYGYINGIKYNIGPYSNGTMLSGTSGANLLFGRRETSELFNGLIDDVRIYNYARTPEQILQDYNAGLSAHFK
jgi:hypothetical protein